jgi:hypothetical protein
VPVLLAVFAGLLTLPVLPRTHLDRAAITRARRLDRFSK